MGRQKQLEGMERQSVKEVDDAAEFYVKQRDTRMRWTKKEKEAKAALIAAMKKHGLNVYKDTEANPPITVVLTAKDEVKVSATDGDEEGGSEETDTSVN